MGQMQLKYAGKGLQIIAINLDAEAALAKGFLDIVPTLVSIVYDLKGKIASDYQLWGLLSSYLIDKKAVSVLYIKDSLSALNPHINKN